MKKFMDENFLLETETAKKLFIENCKDEPIFDYHCHLEAKTIYENNKFDSIGELWLNDDHYKYRLMRAAGVKEKYISGNATWYEKFCSFAKILPLAIGNPVYHWSHLELKRYFNINEPLDEYSCKRIWGKCNSVINEENLCPQKMITLSKVEKLCTTEDPLLDFKYHKLLVKTFPNCKVLPAWRPDKVLNIKNNSFSKYIQKLSSRCEINILSIKDLKKALIDRMHEFDKNGCIASDHDINKAEFYNITEEQANYIFLKGLNSEVISEIDYLKYKSYMLCFLAKEYKKLNWAMELHIGCNRNANSRLVEEVGEAKGFDSVGDFPVADGIGAFLDYMSRKSELPRTVLFNLNQKDSWVLAALANSFQNDGEKSPVQYGTAWWFQDHKMGMEYQLNVLANSGLIGTFIGMLTDSRSFLSYSRHEYFRRILCNWIGNLVESGQYPYNENLEKIVKNICFKNANDYFFH